MNPSYLCLPACLPVQSIHPDNLPTTTYYHCEPILPILPILPTYLPCSGRLSPSPALPLPLHIDVSALSPPPPMDALCPTGTCLNGACRSRIGTTLPLVLLC